MVSINETNRESTKSFKKAEMADIGKNTRKKHRNEPTTQKSKLYDKIHESNYTTLFKSS